MKRLILSSIILVFGHMAAAVTIPNVPPLTATTAEPNVLYILDDSGSMGLSFIPDELCGDRTTKRVKSAYLNKLYYNPMVKYSPPIDHNGSSLGDQSFTSAQINGYSTGTAVNLSSNFKPTWSGSGTGCSDSNNYAHSTGEPAYYYVFNAGNASCDGTAGDEDCYTKVVVSSTSGPGSTDERVNFANWYSYYRTRLMAAKAGTMRAFAQLGTNVRTAYGRINKGSASIDGVNTKTIARGVRNFSGSDRQSFFDWIKAVDKSTFTPLRRALDDAGIYFSRTDDKGPYNETPGVAGGSNLSCRQNFTIMMTDGYWNSDQAGTSNARDNNDGNNGSTITGPDGQSYTYTASSPFKDTYSNTLADVAMYYWKTDLTTLTNNVPTNSRDPAFWQHMVTFGLGLGVPTSVDPATAFAAMYSGIPITWPDPDVSFSGYTGLPAGRADDLLHAGVNGHGGFFNAQTPEDFVTSLHSTLQGIINRTGSLSSVITNSTSLSTDAQVFQALFDSGTWTGELLAYPITGTGVSSTPNWKASEGIPTPASRNIYTRSSGAGQTFTWSALSPTDQTAIGSTDVLDYLRGVRSKEMQNGGTLRNRSATNILGDVIHSSPFYVKDSGTTYVNANDGMLHAFNSTSGAELFAYVPSAVISRLKNLSQPSYTHEYFVDGDIAVSSQSQTTGHNYLVAALGHGGKGLFGLDVTNPGSFTSTNALWEYFDSSDDDLGYMLGRPVIAKMNDGSWAAIVGNGYNSTSGKAVLYVIDLATGAVIKKIDTLVASDNGLAAPAVFDSDNDGDVDAIYAGDLKGNVWKFDVSNSDPTQWNSAFLSGTTPQPFFTAKDASNNPQPITAQVSVVVNDVASDSNYGKRFIYFGTGSYFRDTDASNTQVQSWYGLIDEGTRITSRSTLKQRTVLDEGTFSGKPVRTFSAATSGDMAGLQGWYLDFSTQSGERIITASKVYKMAQPTLIASSIIPTVNPCSPGGSGYINAIDPFTGARLSQGFFDVNGSSVFTDDKLSGNYIGGVDLGVGMPSEPVIVGNRLVVGGSSGNLKDILVNAGGTHLKGRISWREIIRN